MVPQDDHLRVCVCLSPLPCLVKKLKAERHFLHNPKQLQQQLHLWPKQKSKGEVQTKNPIEI